MNKQRNLYALSASVLHAPERYRFPVPSKKNTGFLQVLFAPGAIRPRRCETQNRLRKTMPAMIANSDNVDVAGSGT